MPFRVVNWSNNEIHKNTTWLGHVRLGQFGIFSGHQYRFVSLYYEAVTKNETNEVLFLGRYWENTVVYSYVIAASYLTISILSPYLAAMADRTGRRKVFMRTFMIMGALSTSCMGLFTAANPLVRALPCLSGERRLYGFYCFLQQLLTGYCSC
jgi:MFS family permease